VRHPASHIEAERDIGLSHRVLYAADHKEITDVVDRHDDDDQAAQHVDTGQSIRSRVASNADVGHLGMLFFVFIERPNFITPSMVSAAIALVS